MQWLDKGFRSRTLFELGKLERFCRMRAATDLLVGADDLTAWSRTSTDAFRLLEREPAALTWQRMRDGELLGTPNIGCAGGCCGPVTRCSVG